MNYEKRNNINFVEHCEPKRDKSANSRILENEKWCVGKVLLKRGNKTSLKRFCSVRMEPGMWKLGNLVLGRSSRCENLFVNCHDDSRLPKAELVVARHRRHNPFGKSRTTETQSTRQCRSAAPMHSQYNKGAPLRRTFAMIRSVRCHRADSTAGQSRKNVAPGMQLGGQGYFV